MHYDVAIIGAGMSGLAAGIRLAYFDRGVLIVEKHYAFGGLNSYYTLNGREFDVGDTVTAGMVLSTVGSVETMRLRGGTRLLAALALAPVAFPRSGFDSYDVKQRDMGESAQSTVSLVDDQYCVRAGNRRVRMIDADRLPAA